MSSRRGGVSEAERVRRKKEASASIALPFYDTLAERNSGVDLCQPRIVGG